MYVAAPIGAAVVVVRVEVPYAWSLVYAQIWDVNHFIALRQQERFAQKYGRDKTSSVLPSETQGITFP